MVGKSDAASLSRRRRRSRLRSHSLIWVTPKRQRLGDYRISRDPSYQGAINIFGEPDLCRTVRGRDGVAVWHSFGFRLYATTLGYPGPNATACNTPAKHWDQPHHRHRPPMAHAVGATRRPPRRDPPAPLPVTSRERCVIGICDTTFVTVPHLDSPGYAHENTANSYDLQLPADVGVHPVRVKVGSAWVSRGQCEDLSSGTSCDRSAPERARGQGQGRPRPPQPLRARAVLVRARDERQDPRPHQRRRRHRLCARRLPRRRRRSRLRDREGSGSVDCGGTTACGMDPPLPSGGPRVAQTPLGPQTEPLTIASASWRTWRARSDSRSRRRTPTALHSTARGARARRVPTSGLGSSSACLGAPRAPHAGGTGAPPNRIAEVERPRGDDFESASVRLPKLLLSVSNFKTQFRDRG